MNFKEKVVSLFILTAHTQKEPVRHDRTIDTDLGMPGVPTAVLRTDFPVPGIVGIFGNDVHNRANGILAVQGSLGGSRRTSIRSTLTREKSNP